MYWHYTIQETSHQTYFRFLIRAWTAWWEIRGRRTSDVSSSSSCSVSIGLKELCGDLSYWMNLNLTGRFQFHSTEQKLVPVWTADGSKHVSRLGRLVWPTGRSPSPADYQDSSQNLSNAPTVTAATLWRDPKTPEEVGGTLLPVSWETTYKWKENQVYLIFFKLCINSDNPDLYLSMLVCSSWWQPAVFVTWVSRERRAWTRWSCRGSRGLEESKTPWTDCKDFAKPGYSSLKEDKDRMEKRVSTSKKAAHLKTFKSGQSKMTQPPQTAHKLYSNDKNILFLKWDNMLPV